MVGVGPRLLAPVVMFHLISWVDRRGKVDHAAHKAQTSSGSEVVGNLLAVTLGWHRPDMAVTVAATMNDIINPSDYETVTLSCIVVSTRQRR